MFCKKCGAELPEGTRFCSKCGANLTVGNVQKPEKKATFNFKELFTGTKKKYAIATSAILGVLVAAVLLFVILVLPNMAVNGFKSQIQNREYRDAYLAYEEFDSEDRTKANKWMREYIGIVEEDYYAGKLDYSTATGILEELMQFDAAYNEANKAGENVYLDNQSAIAFDKAKEYAAEKKWQEAYEELENVHIKYRLYDEVSTLRTECVTNVRADALEQINAFATSGEIDKLIAARDLALMVLPDDKEIIQAAQAHLDAFVSKTLADAKTLADNKDFSGAMDLLQYAVSVYEHQDFWSALEGYGYDSAEAHCEALVAQNDLLGAVKYAKGLADADSKYDALLEKYASILVDETLSSAKTLADKRQFTEAIATLNKVLAVYSDSELEKAVEEYKDYLPCALADCHVIDSEDVRVGIDRTDSFGNKHENIIGLQGMEGTVVFNLNQKYVKLDGTFMHTDEYYGTTGQIKIYADEKLIYESPTIEKTTTPPVFSLDVTGTTQLKIVFTASGWGSIYLIVDATLS